MPCARPNASPASATPSTTPATGFSSPTTPTTPAGSRRRPVNQATYAIAVATTERYTKPSAETGVSAGGAPSTRIATGISSTEPPSSCHDDIVTAGMSEPHRDVRM